MSIAIRSDWLFLYNPAPKMTGIHGVRGADCRARRLSSRAWADIGLRVRGGHASGALAQGGSLTCHLLFLYSPLMSSTETRVVLTSFDGYRYNERGIC